MLLVLFSAALFGCPTSDAAVGGDSKTVCLQAAIQKQDAIAICRIVDGVESIDDLVAIATVLCSGLDPKNESDVKEASIRSLIRLGTSADVAYGDLVKMNCGKHEKLAMLRLEALQAINFNNDQTLRAVAEALDDPRSAVRGLAANLIAKHKTNAKIVAKLTTQLKDNSLYVQVQAAHALLVVSADTDKKVVKKIFMTALRDYGSPACGAAASGCGILGKEGNELIPELVKLVGDPKNVAFRASAVNSIGKLKPMDEKTGKFLMELLDDNHPYVSSFASVALVEMGEVAVPLLIVGLESKSRQTQCLAVQSLGNIGEKARTAIPFLIQLGGDHDEGMAALVRSALSKIGCNPR